MKKFILFPLSVCLYSNIVGQTFYDLSFASLSKDTIKASHFATKKVLLIILPLSNNDSVFKQIETFAQEYVGKVQIIGIASFDEGFQNSNEGSLKSLYQNLDIIITEGMNCRKSLKERQSPLMQWLTDYKKNNHFNNDAAEAGTKFFLNETGRLYAVFGRLTSLQHQIIERVMNSPDRTPSQK